MSVIFRGHTIRNKKVTVITSGLLLNLDAGDTSSYPGSGTTWYDVSGNGNNMTLQGTSYATEYGGALYFDPANLAYGYMNFANPKAETIIAWARSNFWYWNNYGWISSSRQENGHIIHPDAATLMGFWIADSGVGFYNISTTTPPDGLNADVPRMYCITTNGTNSHKSYINSDFIAENTGAITRSASPAAAPYWVGCDQTESRFGNGYIYNVLRYNRELSATEITQTFNSLKSRYGY